MSEIWGAYIWEGLLSEGYLCLRFGGLIFGRAYFWVSLLSEFYGILWKKKAQKSVRAVLLGALTVALY